MAEQKETPKNPKEMVDLFSFVTQGVYVVGVRDEKETNAFTAAWLMQTSFDPPLLALSVNPKCLSYKILERSEKCAISVLPSGRIDLAKHFGQSKSQGAEKLSRFVSPFMSLNSREGFFGS